MPGFRLNFSFEAKGIIGAEAVRRDLIDFLKDRGVKNFSVGRLSKPSRPDPGHVDKNPSRISIFTDGGCMNNPGGVGGWAWVRVDPDGTITEGYGGAKATTNNRMEIAAMIKALEALPDDADAVVYTDSQYVQRGITEWMPGWIRRNWTTSLNAPVKNAELWKRLKAAKDRHPRISIFWVKGHRGNKWNEHADVLATKAMKEMMT